MKQTKSKKLTLFASKQSQFQLKVVIAIVLVAALGCWAYMSRLARTTAELANSVNEVKIVVAPRECEKVTSLSFNGSCAPSNYQTISFTCGYKKKVETMGEKTSCKSLSDWYNYASQKCSESCPPVATAQPTCLPRPMCSPNGTKPCPMMGKASDYCNTPIYGTDPVPAN